MFKLIVKKADDKMWEMPFSSLSQNEELNVDRQANFTVQQIAGSAVAVATSVTLEFILSGGYREVYIYDEEEVCTFSGFIDEVNYSSGEGEAGSYNIAAKGFVYLFEKRNTGELVEYSATDAGEIAWDLIDQTQAKPYGDFGITLGLIEPTKDRDRTYKWRFIKDAIQALTSGQVKDGFDFEIDLDKAFNVYEYKGDDREDIIFDADHNIDTYQVKKTGILSMCNHVIMFGEGSGDDMIVVERDADNSYKEAFFLLEDGVSDKDNGDTDLLTDKGDKYLELYRAPMKTPISLTCQYDSPKYTSYSVGDRVRVKIPNFDIDAMMRITKKGVDMSGKVSVTVRAV